MSATERSETIVFYFMLTCAAAGAVTMIWFRVPLSMPSVLWLILCGVLGGVGQICMTYCYRYAEPSLLAPFDYVAMLWAVALGYFIFAEVPERMVMAGAAVVSAAGIVIIWRERYPAAMLNRPPLRRSAFYRQKGECEHGALVRTQADR